MHRAVSAAVLATLLLSLIGCQVLASVFEERTLRTAALVVVVGALVGFLMARMRR